MLLALAVAARGLERRTTWYLASDQFAFLTFADDLAHGRVLHDPSTLHVLAGSPDGPPAPTDAYFQTYLWSDGRLYCRYPPGFPALLAIAGMAGGEAARHLVNPLCYLALLATLAGVAALLARRALGVAAAAAGATAAWAVLLVPTDIHRWGITVARDLPAHLLALLALAAMLGRHVVAAGLLLGFACCIRPDAILWALALGAVALRGRPTARALAGSSAAFLAGVTPLLAYNWATGGHPLAFTQGSEFRDMFFIPSLPALQAGFFPAVGVSGGGFRLRNLSYTLPHHLAWCWTAFGTLLLPAAGAVAWSLRRDRTVAAALATYAPVGLLFFSCWGHPDTRYLFGVALCILLLTSIGLATAAAWLGDARGGRARRLGLAAAYLIAVVAAPSLPGRPQPDRVHQAELASGVALAIAAAAGAVGSWRGLAAPSVVALVPAIALAVVTAGRVLAGSGGRDPMQRPQVARARSAIESVVPADALVLTTPALGRPAENVAYYTHADAHYLGELPMLGSTPARTAAYASARGRRVFLLLPAGDAPPPGVVVTEVARRDGAALLDWFVDPAHAPAGAVLHAVTAADPAETP